MLTSKRNIFVVTMTKPEPSLIKQRFGMATGILVFALIFGIYPLIILIAVFLDDYNKEKRQVIEITYPILTYCNGGGYKSESKYYSDFTNSLNIIEHCLSSDNFEDIVNAKAEKKYQNLKKQFSLINSLPETFFDFKLIKDGQLSEVKEFGLYHNRYNENNNIDAIVCEKDTDKKIDDCFEIYHLPQENLKGIINACKNKCIFEGRLYKNGLLGELKLKTILAAKKYEDIYESETIYYNSLKHKTLSKLQELIIDNTEFVEKFDILLSIPTSKP